ncbi:hypothetical protein [Nitrolancea hollandica]|uniref:Uncharacterized protein n=1 Tax=Nitrolancea hollandica Lb TaxID=1129897 RepID=I4EL36_9BACT|nr:hypothetical protein [Nitrolancea hollandica]CCF85398.1 hypothetical protein NITHO_4920009 [Nitrolancea hollandica Lb]
MALLTKVGSFTGGGSLGNQSVTGVGFQPKVLILWSSNQTAINSWSDHAVAAIGMTTGPSNAYSVSAAISASLGTRTNASRRMAAKAISISDTSEQILSEADLVSFDADGFTLDWTNTDTNVHIMYLALGGDAVQSAKVVNWQMPTSTGNKVVTGVGFEPDFILNAWTNVTDTIPFSVAHAAFGLGAADGTNEWALNTLAIDDVTTTDTQRGQVTDASAFLVNTDLSVGVKGSLTSFNPDGFTYNFTSVINAYQVITLALKGPAIQVGSFTKPTLSAPAGKDVATTFDPKAVFLASVMNTAQAAPAAHWRVGLGASDGTNQRATLTTDRNARAYFTSSGMAARLSTDNSAFEKDDNDNKASEAVGTLSLGTGKFSLNFPSTNDATATEILYFTFGEGGTIYDETTGEQVIKAVLSGIGKATYLGTSGTVPILAISGGTDGLAFDELDGDLTILTQTAGTDLQAFSETSGLALVKAPLTGTDQTNVTESGLATIRALLAGEDFKGFDETAGAVLALVQTAGSDTEVMAEPGQQVVLVTIAGNGGGYDYDETSGQVVALAKFSGTDGRLFTDNSGPVLIPVKLAGSDAVIGFLLESIQGSIWIPIEITGTIRAVSI